MKAPSPSGDYVLEDLYALARKPGLSSHADDLKSFFQQNSLLVNLLDNAATFFFIIDFSRMEYLYVSDGIFNIMGYTAEEWKREGLEAAFRTIYPEDVLRLKKLNKDLFDFHYRIPVQQRPKYRYAFDFRVVRKDGQVIWMLEQNSMIAMDADGKPTIGFEICSEITHLKKDNTMTLSVMQTDHIQSSRKFYYPLEGTDRFTNREVQILQHLHRGLSSKQIAGALSISELTVSKHRMNMMKKANVSNAACLINYALKNKLL